MSDLEGMRDSQKCMLQNQHEFCSYELTETEASQTGPAPGPLDTYYIPMFNIFLIPGCVMNVSLDLFPSLEFFPSFICFV